MRVEKWPADIIMGLRGDNHLTTEVSWVISIGENTQKLLPSGLGEGMLLPYAHSLHHAFSLLHRGVKSDKTLPLLLRCLEIRSLVFINLI